MTAETTTQEFRGQLLHGWFVSCLLHGLLLFSFLPLFRQSLITVHQEPFHWDVALIQSTEVANKPAQPANTTEPTVSRPAKHASIPAHTNRRTPNTTSPATDSTSPEPKTDTLIASEFKPDSPSSTTPPAESPLASTIEEPRPNLPPPSDSPPQQTEQSLSSTTEATQPLPPTTTTSDNATVPTTQPDYGWLQQAIFRRLEELKRSSHPRVDQSQPLKVLVRAVVSHEGALLDAEVVKSSGLDRIDQEAMALVQRAFPMQLDHTLDRRQIAMRIPITYSRE